MNIRNVIAMKLGSKVEFNEYSNWKSRKNKNYEHKDYDPYNPGFSWEIVNWGLHFDRVGFLKRLSKSNALTLKYPKHKYKVNYRSVL